MKKFIYLCCMMLLSANMMAQIDLNDPNWDTVLMECFDESASFWQWDTENFLNTGNYSWKGYIGSTLAPNGEHEVYQFDNCRINTNDGTMHLVAYYDSTHRIQRNEYYLPKWMWTEYGGHGYPYSDDLFYFSGAIEYYKKRYVQNEDERKFLYGYFEIRCKLPKHKGAFPAFWLHSANPNPTDPYYEEIDIFEYSWGLGDPHGYQWAYSNPNPTYAGDPYLITTGIYHNLHGQYTYPDADAYARNYPRLPQGYGHHDISGWHTYSCEWMPDHVCWYLDGQLVNSYHDIAHIPQHPMRLKTNYAINGYYGYGGDIWKGPDKMIIDYIKVCQLKWDCNTDETITCQSDLDGFDYAVKKTVSIVSTINQPIVSSGDKATFRVADSFEITGPFEVQSGGEFTVILQECPN